MSDYSESPNRGDEQTRQYLDVDTGEIVEICIKSDDPQARSQQGTVMPRLALRGGESVNIAYPFKWVAVFLPAFKRIIQAGLTNREANVLYEMLQELQYGNKIDVPHRIIAESLGIDRANVSRAIKKLVEADILQKFEDPNDRGRSIYKLNNIVGWRGKSGDWHKDRERGNVIRGRFGRKTKKPATTRA